MKWKRPNLYPWELAAQSNYPLRRRILTRLSSEKSMKRQMSSLRLLSKFTRFRTKMRYSKLKKRRKRGRILSRSNESTSLQQEKERRRREKTEKESIEGRSRKRRRRKNHMKKQQRTCSLKSFIEAKVFCPNQNLPHFSRNLKSH